MLPFGFNANDDGKRVRDVEESYESRGRQRRQDGYYQQYEERQASRYDGGGNESLAEIQARLAETERQIRALNEEEKEQFQHPILPDFNQPPPGFNAPPPSRDRRRSRTRSRSPRSRDRSRSRERRRHSSRGDERRRPYRGSGRDRSHSRSPSNASLQGSKSSSSSSRYSRRRRSRSASRDRIDANGAFWRKDRNSRRSDRYSDWNPGYPTNKLAILNMPNDVDNTKITFALGKCGYLPQDVRTMTKFDKMTKQIKTFAFVEFSDQSIAEQWMTDFQGWLTLDDGRNLAVEYAKGDPAAGGNNKGDDWICAHCSMNNFMKRQTCFKCEISKEQSMELEKLGAHMVGISPCDTLLIRGLPDNCSHNDIFDSLASLVCLSSINMVKLSDSKRFAYLQMKSSDEAKMLLNLTYKAPIKIRNKDVQVSWCRDSISKLIQQQMTMLTAGPKCDAQGQMPQGSNKTGAEIAAAAISKANAVRQASHQVGQLMSHPGQEVLIPANFSIPPPNLSAPPPTIVQQQPEHQNGVIGVTQTPHGVMPRYVTPNPATFGHDASLGYYVDPMTKFCYDAATGYYFNNETGKWCTWEPTYQTYVAVPETTPTAATSAAETSKKEEEEGTKNAADLVKDMEKWAKRQEKDKKKVQISLKSKETPSIRNVFQHEKQRKLTTSSILADDDDEDDDVGNGSVPRRLQDTEPSTSSPSVVAPRKPTLQEVRDAMERALYDETKKTCLLCKRAFSDVEVLRKHVEKSELHRKNLEAKRVEWGRETAEKLREEEEKQPELPKIVYRDRAKERRRQYGIDSTGYAFDVMGGGNGGGASSATNHSASSSARNEDAIRRDSEEARMKPLDASNIGNRLLKSMGWKEGQGVGKHAQGIVNPIEAERFVQGAGLGAAGSKMRHGVEASHKEKTRQALYSRYHDA